LWLKNSSNDIRNTNQNPWLTIPKPEAPGVLPKNKPQTKKEETPLGPHWQKALVFIARTQNVKAVNDMPYATDDGGFIYETGYYKEDRSHSYGSMTYAGLKSLLFARVDKEDIRVK